MCASMKWKPRGRDAEPENVGPFSHQVENVAEQQPVRSGARPSKEAALRYFNAAMK